MIAARFRLVGWVAGCAGAALVCYMASQSVAAERSALAKVDADIARTQADVDRLQTEITARSRASQRERWNDTLALQAARPVQYVSSGFQLASLAGDRKLPIDQAVLATRGAVSTVAYRPQSAPPASAAVAVQATPVVAAAPAPRLLTVAAHVEPTSAAPLLHQATFVRPRPSRLADDATPLLHTASLEKIGPAKLATPRLADPKPATSPRKLAKADDSLLPDDLGKLIAQEHKTKSAKTVL